MPHTTLFVCQSCHYSTAEPPEGHSPDGEILRDRLADLAVSGQIAAEIHIESVGCLWTCDEGCAIACSAPDKATYLFTKLTLEPEATTALVEFAHLHHRSPGGDLPWKKFPAPLQTAKVAKIPPLAKTSNLER